MRKLNLLIIEDDPLICELVRLYAEKEGHGVMEAHDGITGLDKVYEEHPDMVLLDVMLPGMGGWEICERLRKESGIPVIMLTGKGEAYDRIRGLNLGADDYIVKPFDPKELMARIQAVLRRYDPSFMQETVITAGGVSLDMGEYVVRIANEVLTLPPKEMELLYYLVKNPNRVFTRQQLLDQIWGYLYEGDPRTVDVHIKRVREKLKAYATSSSITTIRGVGYKFEVVLR
ncbi:winged helix family two component transcriptional regulator [Paenibacillus algicola]|uniref:Heme response regulator HssR n=1 Tax=Paenibacillus algicola TaxID=2565926 RepID=A0A4P8XM78_9BACL|nr:response regulator transcription factor [Paenibacillus algicola]QCT03543.1 winged helix family two component transcriptional regulator [Paenibacillus algicola]